MSKVDLVLGKIPPPLKKRELRKLVQAAAFVLRHEGKEKGKLTLMITGDEEIAYLNARFKGVDEPTDVLAFFTEVENGFILAPEAKGYLGDVVISWQRAEEQARELDHTLMEELITLTIHGVLHLLGYRDYDEEERRKMWARQEELKELFMKEGP